MLDLNDTSFMKDSIDEVEEFTGETITVFTVSSSTGTKTSLRPITTTWGSENKTAIVRRISARELNESGGIYKADDLVISSEGSFSQDTRIVYRAGTYEVIEKQIPSVVDEQDIRYRVVVRRG